VKLGYNELGYNELGYNELSYNELGFSKLGYKELGYNELGYNEHSVITNEYLGPKCPFTTQNNPVITNPDYNERILPVLKTEFHSIRELDKLSFTTTTINSYEGFG